MRRKPDEWGIYDHDVLMAIDAGACRPARIKVEGLGERALRGVMRRLQKRGLIKYETHLGWYACSTRLTSL